MVGVTTTIKITHGVAHRYIKTNTSWRRHIVLDQTGVAYEKMNTLHAGASSSALELLGALIHPGAQIDKCPAPYSSSLEDESDEDATSSSSSSSCGGGADSLRRLSSRR